MAALLSILSTIVVVMIAGGAAERVVRVPSPQEQPQPDNNNNNTSEVLTIDQDNQIQVFEKREREPKRSIKINQSKTCKCGESFPKDKIVGGTESTIDEFPWLVALLKRQMYTVYQFCGASIINNKYLLTAAHCFSDGTSAHGLYASIGDHDLSTMTETESLTVKIKQVILHPGYLKATHVNDIAVLKLATTLPFSKKIVPVCLPSIKETYSEMKAIIAGWGAVAFRGEAPDVQLKAEIKLIANSECGRKYVLGGTVIVDSMLCGSDPVKDTCQGDSGGPLIVRKGDRMVLPGVVSFGRGCANPDFPGVYTRVSSFLTWILENTKDGMFCQGSVEGY